MSAHPSSCSLHRIALLLLLALGISSIDGEAAANDLMGRGIRGDQIWLSMERNMQCGIGLCGHCQYGPYFVCKEGPVFTAAKVSQMPNDF